jgi:hypothetical protein
MAPAPAVQRLYDVCKKAFTSLGVPSESQVQSVRTILDTIRPSDVGLGDVEQQNRGFGDDGQGEWRSILPRWAPPISYLHLYECELFSMGIFCLPTSATIPLHNHPGMTVLSRLLYGSMHVRAYDWVDPDDERRNSDPSLPRQARLVVDHVLSDPASTEVLYPMSGGNIHAFTAVTPCAVLDVLAPPYSSSTGRHCTYYRTTANTGVAGGFRQTDGESDELRFEWLEYFSPPDDFVVQRGHYEGPRIVA